LLEARRVAMTMRLVLRFMVRAAGPIALAGALAVGVVTAGGIAGESALLALPLLVLGLAGALAIVRFERSVRLARRP
jgi:hypothetical protein